MTLVAALLVGLLACQSGSSVTQDAVTKEPESAPQTPAELAPNFMVTMLQGQDEVGGEQAEPEPIPGQQAHCAQLLGWALSALPG